MLANEHPCGAREIEVDVREQQVAYLAQLEPALAETLLQRRHARGGAAVEQRRPLGRFQHVGADDALLPEVEEIERLHGRAQAVAAAEPTRASSRSSSRSSADSSPTESRTRFGGAAKDDSTVEACVIRAGTSIRLSTPPRLSASFQIFVRATSPMASSSEAARNEIMPPNSRICRAAMRCPGWWGRPG